MNSKNNIFKIGYLNISSSVGHGRAIAVLINRNFNRALGRVAQVVFHHQLEDVLALSQAGGIAFGSIGRFNLGLKKFFFSTKFQMLH
jgi:hypothetical protein